MTTIEQALERQLVCPCLPDDDGELLTRDRRLPFIAKGIVPLASKSYVQETSSEISLKLIFSEAMMFAKTNIAAIALQCLRTEASQQRAREPLRILWFRISGVSQP